MLTITVMHDWLVYRLLPPPLGCVRHETPHLPPGGGHNPILFVGWNNDQQRDAQAFL